MPFDPNKPFEVVGDKEPSFDPSKPFEVLDEKALKKKEPTKPLAGSYAPVEPFSMVPKPSELEVPSISKTEPTLPSALPQMGIAEDIPVTSGESTTGGGDTSMKNEAVEGFINALNRGVKQGEVADLLAAGKQPTKDDLRKIAQLKRAQSLLPSSKPYEEFNAAPNLKASIGKFIENPIEISSQLVGESMAAMLRHGYSRMLAGAGEGAVVGSVIPGAGTLAGAGLGTLAGMTMAGYNLETASSILESLKESGIDISNEESLIKGFEDEEKMSKARDYALKRAVPIAVFDIVSGGIGGKILGTPSKSIISKALKTGAEAGVQSTLAGTGEAAAQLLSEGKIKPTEIFAEMIGEAAGGAPDIAVGTMIEKTKNNESITKDIASTDLRKDVFDDMVDISEGIGEITPQQSDEIKAQYELVQSAKEKTPQEFKNNPEIIESIANKEILKSQISAIEQDQANADEVFKPLFEEKKNQVQSQIDKIDENINNQAKQQATEAKAEAVRVQESKKRQDFVESKTKEIQSLLDDEYVKKFIDDGHLNAINKDRSFNLRPDFDLPTAEVKKGIEDIKTGKDSTASRKLKEAIISTKESGEIPMIQGTGGTTERTSHPIGEFYEETPIELTKEDIIVAEKIDNSISDDIKQFGFTLDNIDEAAKAWGFPKEEVQTIKNYLQNEAGIKPETTTAIGTKEIIAESKTPARATEEIQPEKRLTEVPAKPPSKEPPKSKESGGGEKPKLSGIAKSQMTEEEKTKIGEEINWNKITDTEFKKIGKEEYQKNPKESKKIVDSVVFGDKTTLEPKEVSQLIHYKADLDKQLIDTRKEKNELLNKNEDTKVIDEKIRQLDEDIKVYDTMAFITGASQSSAFRLRQYLIDSTKFNLDKEIEYYKSVNGGKISTEEKKFFEDKSEKIKELEQRIKELEAEKESGEAEFNNIKESVGREDRRASKGDKIKEASKRLAAKIRKGKISRPDVFSASSPASLVWDGALEIIAKTVEAGGSITKAVNDAWQHIQDSEWYKTANKDIKDKAKKGFDNHINEELDYETFSPTVKDGKLNIPSKLIRDYIKSGIKDIEELINKLHERIKEENPEITKREVRDAITGYGKTVNKTKNEIATELNRAKRYGRLLSKKEDLGKGIKPSLVKIGVKKIEDYEKQLRNEIKALESGLGITSEKNLSIRKEMTKKHIAEYERMLKEGDYSKKEKASTIEDDEIIQLKSKKEALLDIIREKQYDAELQNRTFTKKAIDLADEVFGGLSRLLIAGLDLGAAGVQGGKRILSHPIEAKEAFVKSIKSIGSKEYSDNLLNNIKAQKWYPAMKEAGVKLNDTNYRSKVQEEIPAFNIIGTLWNLPPSLIEKIIGSNKATTTWKEANPYNAAQRAFNSYVNSIRTSAFLDMAQKVESDGVNLKTEKEKLKAIGEYVNIQTSRGGLGKYESSSQLLSSLLFSARRLASTVKFMSPIYYGKLPKHVRKQAIIESAKSLAALSALSILANAIANEKDDRDWDEFFDPNSSNFMSIKIKGDKGTFETISFINDIKSYINVLSRVGSGNFRDAATGVKSELGDRYGKPINTRWDAFTSFLSNKFSPGISFFKKILNQKKGEEMNTEDLALETLTPMWTGDLLEIYETHPEIVASIITSLNILGFGVHHYELNKQKQFERETRLKNPDELKNEAQKEYDKIKDLDEEDFKEKKLELPLVIQDEFDSIEKKIQKEKESSMGMTKEEKETKYYSLPVKVKDIKDKISKISNEEVNKLIVRYKELKIIGPAIGKELWKYYEESNKNIPEALDEYAPKE